MDLWEKLTVAREQLQEKKDNFHSVVGLLASEWKDASSHLASANSSLKECIIDQEALWEKRQAELNSKENDMQRRKSELDSTQASLGVMKDRLRSNESDLERRERELDSREAGLEAMKDRLRSNERDLERRIRELDSREAGLEKMKDGLRSNERDLEIRKDDLDSKEKYLEAMEDGLRSNESDLERMKAALDSREAELNSAETCFEAMKARPVSEHEPVKRLASAIYNESSKDFCIKKGRGTALKDIPNVADILSRKSCNETLKALHRILFSRRGEDDQIKSNILRFSGFVWHANEETEKLRLRKRLHKNVKESLVEMCEILGVAVSNVSTKMDIVVKLMEFLEAPHATTSASLTENEQVGKGLKRKRSSKGSAPSKGLAKSGEKAADKSEEKKKKPKVKKPSAVVSKVSTRMNSEKEKDTRSEFTDDELKAAICEILKQMDWSENTFGDILKDLGARFKTDFLPRKSSIKRMVAEELSKADDEEDR